MPVAGTGGNATQLNRTKNRVRFLICDFDGESHSSENCPKTVEQRKAALTAGGKCFNCFSSEHYSRDCTKAYTCRHCKGKHNSLMCRRGGEATTHRAAVGSTIGAVLGQIQGRVQEGVVMAGEVVADKILPPERQAHEENYQTVIAYLDPGSAYSFIRRQTAQQLGLPALGEQELNVLGFGEVVARSQQATVHMVKLQNQMEDTFIGVPVLAVEQIVGNVPVTHTSSVGQRYATVDTYDAGPPDVLIGAADYHDLNPYAERVDIPGGKLYSVSTDVGVFYCGRKPQGTVRIATAMPCVAAEDTPAGGSSAADF